MSDGRCPGSGTSSSMTAGVPAAFSSSAEEVERPSRRHHREHQRHEENGLCAVHDDGQECAAVALCGSLVAGSRGRRCIMILTQLIMVAIMTMTPTHRARRHSICQVELGM